jgi:DNA mismatch endonuclease (patch repair protein)
VFHKYRLIVFCDGDFWHGRALKQRLNSLKAGHNASYWTAKIAGNAARDRSNDRQLRRIGWHVLRLWEGDIRKDVVRQADTIDDALRTLGAPI